MYDDIINATRQEVIRLIDQLENIITNLLETPNLLQERDANQLRNLDKEEVQFWKQTLTDEKYKVRRLEMTLAVVGTMKAGKSTTINAIVGTEVLPNRNQPMTTLPTLITHSSNQKIPKLHFTKPEPFNKAIEDIKKELLAHTQNNSLKRLKMFGSKDGESLIQSIVNGNFAYIEKQYSGVEEIYLFLKKLNDISRLCDELNLSSPLVHYDKIEEFPTIQVEFFHLKNGEGNHGCFTLIDTPGPNEAGANYLKNILRDQIEKASGVLAIMDYTQLNAEAEEEVRDSLRNIVENYADRLYIMVNKFDERDRNGMNKEELQKYVSHHLFCDKVNLDRIHPVSSNWAYLANRALNELEQFNDIPDPDSNKWVIDFAEEALGRRWKRAINDHQQVKESAAALWEDSLFDKPLNQVIQHAFENSALLSLLSAIDKMLYYDTHIIQTLGFSKKALLKNVDELKLFIKDLESDIDQIKSAKDNAIAMSNILLEKIAENLKEIFEKTSKKIDSAIDEFFKNGKREEKQRIEQIKNSQEPSNFLVLPTFSSFISKTKAPKAFEFDPNSSNSFDSENDAKIFVDELMKVIKSIDDEYLNNATKTFDGYVSEMQKEFWNDVQVEIAPILDKASKRMKEEFKLELEFPNPSFDSFQIDFDELEKDSIREDTEERIGIRYVRKWYTLFLIKHKEYYEYDMTTFKVDTKKIQNQISTDMMERNKKLKQAIKNFVTNKIEPEVDEYFDELSTYLERFRGDLFDALKKQKLKKNELNNLVRAMENNQLNTTEHIKDCEPLREGIKELDKQKDLVNNQ